jgi:hypothetical protein
MTAIGNLSSVGAAHAPPAHQNAPQPKTQQSQSGPDTVHLSKAALAGFLVPARLEMCLSSFWHSLPFPVSRGANP